MQRRRLNSTGIRAGIGRGARYLAYLAVAVACAGMSFPVGASAAPDDVDKTGEIEQKLAEAGCVSQSGADGDGGMTCSDGRVLRSAVALAVSPDGQSVYVTSFNGSGIAIFDRATDGTLTQNPGEAGCISQTGADSDLGMTCAEGRGLQHAHAVTVSPDGTSVYVSSFLSDAVAVFDRAADGTLTQKDGPAGCISQTGADGDGGMTCADGRGLDGGADIRVSPDGRSVYSASFLGDAVAVFDRAADGTLTQKPGPAGCISQTGDDGDRGMTCSDGRGLHLAVDLAVNPDGNSLYVTAVLSDAVTIFDRAADGTLTQKPGEAGCISQTGDDGDRGMTCADGRGLDGAHAVIVSPDSQSVYVAAPFGDAVSVFDRAADGTLTQKPGEAGCISQTGADGDLGMTCADARGFLGAHGVAVSPDGQSFYVPALVGDAVAVFDRAADGTVAQKDGPAGCISQTGADGDGGMTCADGRGLDGGVPVEVSPDGRSLYVGALFFGDAVAVFDRNPAFTKGGA
jgi:DNA-binding beta-propeller fold protein YncE